MTHERESIHYDADGTNDDLIPEGIEQSDDDIEPTGNDISSMSTFEQLAYESDIVLPSELDQMLVDSTGIERPNTFDYWREAMTLPYLSTQRTQELIIEHQQLTQELINLAQTFSIYQRIEVQAPEEWYEVEKIQSKYKQRLNDINTTIISHNSRLIVWMVKKFRPALIKADMTMQDGFQEGSRGMLRAIEKFKPELNANLSRCATWWVRQAIQRAVQKGGMIRHPANVHVHLNQLRHVIKQTLHNDAPIDSYSKETITALANTANQLGYTSLTPTHIEELLNLKTLTVVSTDKPIDSTPDYTIIENVASKDDTEKKVINCIAGALLEDILMKLTAKEEQVIRLYYGLMPNRQGLTFEEIGAKYGQTRQRIQQIESEARKKIRMMIAQQDIVEMSSITD